MLEKNMSEIKINTGVKKMAVLYRFRYNNEYHYFNKLIEVRLLFLFMNKNIVVEKVKVEVDNIPNYYTSHEKWIDLNL